MIHIFPYKAPVMTFRYVLIVFCVLCTTHFVAAQSHSSRGFNTGLEGMLGISINANSLAVNVGGPNLKYRFNEDVSLGIGAFPSLIITNSLTPVEGYPEPRIEPKLGLSPRLDINNWVLIAPVYHFNTPQRWLWTFGIGYKFH